MSDFAIFRPARFTTILVGLLVCGLSAGARAGSNPEVEAANQLYEQGHFQEALVAYARMAQKRPESAELQFNQGAAFYQLGDLERARAAFEAAAALSEEETLKAASAYNLGNCALTEGQARATEKPDEAIAALNESLGYYKDALARDKSLSQAANNLELAKRTIRDLKQQMAQQQQQQEQQQKEEQQKKEEEMKEKLDELIQQQEQQAQQSEQAAQQQQQQQVDPTQPGPSPEQMEQMAGEQGQTRGDTEQLAEEMADSPNGDPEAKEQVEQAAQKQKEAEEHLKNQEAEQANAAQEEALEKMKQARESLEKSGDQKPEDQQASDQSSQGEDQQSQDGQESPQDGQESPQDEQPPSEGQSAENMKDVPPPDAKARDILNQEQRNKDERNTRRMVRIRPVEKDW